MITLEEVQKYKNQLGPSFYDYAKDFIFIDFEVFKEDWMLCFSLDGIIVRPIVNDIEKLKHLFLNKFSDRIIVAYNGNAYDKFIMLALLNGLDPKEISDKLITEFNFNFNFAYGKRIEIGRNLMWYDPMDRLAGSLKTYEACQGENIYESRVPFDIDRKLNENEIKETIEYCSFDTQMVAQYFFRVKFESFLGHIGLCDQTIKKRGGFFSNYISRTDASMVGTLLCKSMADDKTKSKDIITLPDNILLGKYTDEVNKFLSIPINTLKTGNYNDLNAWAAKIVEKSINRCDNNEVLDKLTKKKESALNKIKKAKTELQTLNGKEKLTEKQQEKIVKLPDLIEQTKLQIQELSVQIDEELKLQLDLRALKIKMEEFNPEIESEEQLGNYRYHLKDLVSLAKVTDNARLSVLVAYLNQTFDEFYRIRYFVTDKKNTNFDSVLIKTSFELILKIKGIDHLFKTGGIHSVAPTAMTFEAKKSPNERLIIADVNSLYPSLMVKFGLCSIGMDDLNKGVSASFAQMIDDRVALKKAGDAFANVLKLILNTAYGCMGSEFNNLYDPANRLKVCIYGQACIVDLLDKLEDFVPSLVIYQSNTDGIIVSCHKDEEDELKNQVKLWEDRTKLGMSYDPSLALFQKDVSNYILLSEELDKNGQPKIKTKGTDVGKKNAHNNSLAIINKAIRNYFIYDQDNMSIENSFHKTMQENPELINYQIIKKRTAKTTYVNADDLEELHDKVLRLFPVQYGGLRIVNGAGAKVPEVPERTVLVKENILDKTYLDIKDFDINYYKQYFNDKIKAWQTGFDEDNYDENFSDDE